MSIYYLFFLHFSPFFFNVFFCWNYKKEQINKSIIIHTKSIFFLKISMRINIIQNFQFFPSESYPKEEIRLSTFFLIFRINLKKWHPWALTKRIWAVESCSGNSFKITLYENFLWLSPLHLNFDLYIDFWILSSIFSKVLIFDKLSFSLSCIINSFLASSTSRPKKKIINTNFQI